MFEHLLDLVGLGTPSATRQRLPVATKRLHSTPGARGAHPAGGRPGAARSATISTWRRPSSSSSANGGASTSGGSPRWAGTATPDGSALGVIGDAAWDPQARVRLRLGPLTHAEFDAFLPGGAAARAAPLAGASLRRTTMLASSCSSCLNARGGAALRARRRGPPRDARPAEGAAAPRPSAAAHGSPRTPPSARSRRYRAASLLMSLTRPRPPAAALRPRPRHFAPRDDPGEVMPVNLRSLIGKLNHDDAQRRRSRRRALPVADALRRRDRALSS